MARRSLKECLAEWREKYPAPVEESQPTIGTKNKEPRKKEKKTERLIDFSNYDGIGDIVDRHPSFCKASRAVQEGGFNIYPGKLVKLCKKYTPEAVLRGIWKVESNRWVGNKGGWLMEDLKRTYSTQESGIIQSTRKDVIMPTATPSSNSMLTPSSDTGEQSGSCANKPPTPRRFLPFPTNNCGTFGRTRYRIQDHEPSIRHIQNQNIASARLEDSSTVWQNSSSRYVLRFGRHRRLKVVHRCGKRRFYVGVSPVARDVGSWQGIFNKAGQRIVAELPGQSVDKQWSFQPRLVRQDISRFAIRQGKGTGGSFNALQPAKRRAAKQHRLYRKLRYRGKIGRQARIIKQFIKHLIRDCDQSVAAAHHLNHRHKPQENQATERMADQSNSADRAADFPDLNSQLRGDLFADGATNTGLQVVFQNIVPVVGQHPPNNRRSGVKRRGRPRCEPGGLAGQKPVKIRLVREIKHPALAVNLGRFPLQIFQHFDFLKRRRGKVPDAVDKTD